MASSTMYYFTIEVLRVYYTKLGQDRHEIIPKLDC